MVSSSSHQGSCSTWTWLTGYSNRRGTRRVLSRSSSSPRARSVRATSTSSRRSSPVTASGSSSQGYVSHRSPAVASAPTGCISASGSEGAGGATARTSTIAGPSTTARRSEEHTSELQSRENLVCRLLLEKKKQKTNNVKNPKTGK